MAIFIATIAVMAWPQLTVAQSEDEGRGGAGPRQEKPIVELTSVKATQKKKDGKDVWSVKVVGKAPRLPKSTEVEFEVRWRFKALGKFKLELDDSRRFSKEFPVPFINGYVENLALRAYVRPERQPRAVQEELEKRPKEFPPDRVPWVQNFADKKFSCGTEKQVEKQTEDVKKFFEKTIKDLIRLNKDVSSNVKKAMAKEEFFKGDKFDTKKWRDWIEKKNRDPLRKIQKEISAAEKATAYLTQQRNLTYLRDIAAGVAQNSVKKSAKLYKDLGLSVHPDDQSPEGLKTQLKWKPTNKRLEERAVQIADNLGFKLR